MKEKEVYSISELVEMGFPRQKLEKVAHSENFPDCGFKSGRKAYFFLPDLKKELKRRTIAGID